MPTLNACVFLYSYLKLCIYVYIIGIMCYVYM